MRIGTTGVHRQSMFSAILLSIMCSKTRNFGRVLRLYGQSYNCCTSYNLAAVCCSRKPPLLQPKQLLNLAVPSVVATECWSDVVASEAPCSEIDQHQSTLISPDRNKCTTRYAETVDITYAISMINIHESFIMKRTVEYHRQAASHAPIIWMRDRHVQLLETSKAQSKIISNSTSGASKSGP